MLKLTARNKQMAIASIVKTVSIFNKLPLTIKRTLFMSIAKQNALIKTVMCVVQVRKNALNVLLATV